MRKDKRIGRPVTIEGCNAEQIAFDLLKSGDRFRLVIDKEHALLKIRSQRLGYLEIPIKSMFDNSKINADLAEDELDFIYDCLEILRKQDEVQVFTQGFPTYAMYGLNGKYVIEKQFDELILHLPAITIKGDYQELHSIKEFLNLIDPQFGLFIWQVTHGSFDQRVMLQDKEE